jgi:aryl sulfotransferase
VPRYRRLIADSARWERIDLRPGDIVISTPPKSGTTWTQMLCALLVFDGPDFPAPLDQLSPWVDMLTRTVEDVRAAYDAQPHRRFFKTHTPLDGLPWRDDVFYVVVGRDPRDVAVSMEHHMANMDLGRVIELREAIGAEPPAGPPRQSPPEDPAERFRLFVESEEIDGQVTLATLLHHLDTAWQRRSAPGVTLLHYADLRADLPGELHRLGRRLGFDLDEARAAELAGHASLDRMRARAEEVVPSVSLGIWRQPSDFLRAGTSGQWRDRVTDRDVARYDERVASLVPPDLAAWAHQGRLTSGIDPDAR